MPPKKQKRNLTGLRNQTSRTSLGENSQPDTPVPASPLLSENNLPLISGSDLPDLDSGDEDDLPIILDSMKTDWRKGADMDVDSDVDSELSDGADLDDGELFDDTVTMAVADDDGDPDWLPASEVKIKKEAFKGM